MTSRSRRQRAARRLVRCQTLMQRGIRASAVTGVRLQNKLVCTDMHMPEPTTLRLRQEVFRAVLYSDLDFERPPWDTISQDARALIVALLQRDADRRPTAREALSFRYGSTPCGADADDQSHLAISWRELPTIATGRC